MWVPWDDLIRLFFFPMFYVGLPSVARVYCDFSCGFWGNSL